MKTKDIHLPSRPSHIIPEKTVKAVLLDWVRQTKRIPEDLPVACRLNAKGALEIYELERPEPEKFGKEDFLPLE